MCITAKGMKQTQKFQRRRNNINKQKIQENRELTIGLDKRPGIENIYTNITVILNTIKI